MLWLGCLLGLYTVCGWQWGQNPVLGLLGATHQTALLFCILWHISSRRADRRVFFKPTHKCCLPSPSRCRPCDCFTCLLCIRLFIYTGAVLGWELPEGYCAVDTMFGMLLSFWNLCRSLITTVLIRRGGPSEKWVSMRPALVDEVLALLEESQLPALCSHPSREGTVWVLISLCPSSPVRVCKRSLYRASSTSLYQTPNLLPSPSHTCPNCENYFLLFMNCPG